MSRLLLVDDEPSILKILQHFLKDRFNHIETAENGLEALKLIKTSEFDLVISDVSMPEMTGPELLKGMRECGFETRFIYISAYGQKKDELMKDPASPLGFLEKPVSKKVLNDFLDEIIAA